MINGPRKKTIISPGMLAEARRRRPGAVFYPGGAEALPLPDGTFDLVTSTMSFHHWPDPAAGLREIARVLRLGGCFALADVSLPFGLKQLIHHFDGNSPAEWSRLFEQAGLAVVEKRTMLAGFILAMVATASALNL